MKRQSFVWITAAVLASGAAALFCRTTTKEGPRTAAQALNAAPPLPRSVCPILAEAPKPSALAVSEDGGACAVTSNVHELLARGGSLGDNELEKLRSSIEVAVRAQPRACVVELGRELAETKDCGLVFDAVAIRILASPVVPPELAAGELTRAMPCQWKAVAALREAERAEPAIAAMVADLTADPNEDVRNSAWMTLGTLTRIARKAVQSDVAACLEKRISEELRSRHGDLSVLLAAAGNAGCTQCRADLETFAEHADERLRRTAVAAYRFINDEGAVTKLCHVARTDPQPSVRNTATFALRHGNSFLEARLACLFEAATEDENEGVAKDAIASIAELAENSELAVGTLVQILKNAKRDSVRRSAAEALRGFASDDAIRGVLREGN